MNSLASLAPRLSGLSPPPSQPHHQHPPSKVMHVRNLSPTTTDMDLVYLVGPFGQVEKTFVLAQKGQAFVQMESARVAKSVIDYFTNQPVQFRGRTPYFQFSSRQEIVDMPRHDHNNSHQQRQNHILLLNINDIRRPIAIDSIREHVERVGGSVLRIITFVKNGFKALVEMDSLPSASAVIHHMQDSTLMPSINRMHIQYSNLEQLSVRTNNAKMHDFTQPNLPRNQDQHNWDAIISDAMAVAITPSLAGFLGMPYTPPPQVPVGYQQQQSHPQHPNLVPVQLPNGQITFQHVMMPPPQSPVRTPAHPHHGPPPPMNQLYALNAVLLNAASPAAHQTPHMRQQSDRDGDNGPSSSETSSHGDQGRVLLVSNLAADQIIPDYLATLFGVYGDVFRVKILFNKKDTALIQFSNAQQASTALCHLDSQILFGKPMSVTVSRYTEIILPTQIDDDDTPTTATDSSSASSSSPRPNGLSAVPEDAATNADLLSAPPSRHMDAVVVSSSGDRAVAARRGHRRAVSCDPEIHMPQRVHAKMEFVKAITALSLEADRDERALSKDFTNSKAHRFRRIASKNWMNICPPTQVLHVSNIFKGATESVMLDLFRSKIPDCRIQFFATDRRMALVECVDTGAAVKLLIHFHNYLLAGKHIRVSFSRKALDAARPSSFQAMPPSSPLTV